MNRYAGLTDEELIAQQRDGDERAVDFLMEKYKDMVRSKAKTMFLIGADRDDLIQEGMIGLYRAIRDYDPGRDASFATFADLCVSRQIYKAVEAGNRKKHMPLNTYVSLYSGTKNTEEEETSEGTHIIEMLSSLTDNSPEELLIDKENVASLEDRIDEALSDFERQVLQLHITGMSYTEIARILGRDEKSTDNALSRIKSKVKKLIVG